MIVVYRYTENYFGQYMLAKKNPKKVVFLKWNAYNFLFGLPPILVFIFHYLAFSFCFTVHP